MFHITDEEQIRKGLTTDIYFVRTKEILERENIRKKVVAEFTTQSQRYPWNLFTGLDEVVELLKGLPINVWAMPEGTIFPSKDLNGIPIPVMVIEGVYSDFAIYETPVLGLICESSGIATKAARIKKVAGSRAVLSFGIRRMHPAIAPMIDRSAYIGGCDGVSSIIGAKTIGKNPTGTIPHALIINIGSGADAVKAFDKYIDPGVLRIALVDTYGDEKLEAVQAAEALKDKLYGVRLDTPRSRRGSFADIVREVKWELKIRGFKHVKVIVSGGLDEYTIPELIEAGADSFGVGTSVSNANTIDFAMDIVEMEGKPVAKRGKYGGRKKVYRDIDNGRYVYTVIPFNEEYKGELLLQPVLENGNLVYKSPDVDTIRNYVLSQLNFFNEV
jgi:nicotinate phosphoribosyltransferase